MSEESGAPRPFSTEEVEEMFIDASVQIAEEWARYEPDEGTENVDFWRTQGAVFSMLALLDGNRADLTQFIVAPNPHPEDKNYSIGEGESYFPENNAEKISANISGDLKSAFTRAVANLEVDKK